MFSILDQEKVFLSGGIWGLEDIEMKSWYIFNISTNEIFKKADLNIGRAWHGIIKYDHKIFVFGGITNSAEWYDIIKDSWKDLPDMPKTWDSISWVRLQN